jgi:hypothetical protein
MLATDRGGRLMSIMIAQQVGAVGKGGQKGEPPIGESR